MSNGERTGIQSVSRAVSVLQALADSEGELGVTELGRRLGVHKATASRLVATLAEHRLVERNPMTDKYRLGFGLIHLAGSAMAGMDLAREARPVLEDLAERTRETVNLALLQGDQVVNIDQISAPHLVVNVNWVGKQNPMHCTSTGKVLLAFLSPDDRRRLLSKPLPRLTPRTITERATLEKQLQRVREDGYAFTLEELEVGLNAVAAPVRDSRGEVIAAVSVSGPSYRVSPQRLSELGEMTHEAAEAISRRMGFIPSPTGGGKA